MAVYTEVMTDLDIPETARLLGVSERTIRRWLRAGRLTGYRVGGRIRIARSAVREVRAPYGHEGADAGSEPRAEADEFQRSLGVAEFDARLFEQRREAAWTMDEIASRSRPPASPEDTAEGLIRAVRDELETRWDRLDAQRRR
jgi:excisionase family DNA binding protein